MPIEQEKLEQCRQHAAIVDDEFMRRQKSCVIEFYGEGGGLVAVMKELASTMPPRTYSRKKWERNTARAEVKSCAAKDAWGAYPLEITYISPSFIRIKGNPNNIR